MTSDTHNDAFHLAADHVNNNRLEEGLAIFKQLIDSDLDTFGKTMAYINAAVVCDKMGQVQQALDWYDRGIQLERTIGRFSVAQNKLNYCLTQERHADALAMCSALADSGISDLDKATICLYAADVCKKLGQDDKTLEWYDRGIRHERPHYRFNVAEHKAAFLAGKGRTKESLMIYDRLALEASLTEVEKDRIRNNIQMLTNR